MNNVNGELRETNDEIIEIKQKRRFFNLDYFRANIGVLIGLFALMAILSVTTSSFLTVGNFVTVLRQISMNALLAIAITYTIITIGVDLSIGSTVALGGVVVTLCIANGIPVILSIIIALAAGSLIGLANGFIISRTGMPQFIVTLAMQNVVRGLAYIVTDGKSIRSTNETFNSIGNGSIFGVPIPIIIMIVLMLVFAAILNKTRFGRHMYAVGGNKEAAVYSGINVKNTQMMVFVIAGFLASFAGIILASRLYSGQPMVGVGFEGDAIAASVLGGVSFSGGSGTIGGAMIGVLLIGVLNNGMNLLKIGYYWQLIAKGLVILIAVYFDLNKKKKAQSTKV